MKELEIQKYLRAGNTLEKLKEEYFIGNRSHSKYSNLILLKYSQIESDMSNSMVQECRGIILDKDNNWNVISFPYTKFFNIEERNAAKIDWESAAIYDKLDGSLMTLYYYDNEWQIASSGSPDASGDVNGFPFTFKELFWKTWEEKKYELPIEHNVCFMFELCTKYNRIVIPYTENKIILHGARDLISHEEFKPKIIGKSYNWEIIKTYPFYTIKEVMESLQDLPGISSEGYVICDINFNRVKVKNAAYVIIHQMKDGFSTKRMLSLVQQNEGEEFLSYFPEWADLYNEMKKKYAEFINELERAYSETKDIELQKDFAITIQKYPFKSCLFSMRKMKTSAIEEVSKIRIDSLFELLGIKDINLGN